MSTKMSISFGDMQAPTGQYARETIIGKYYWHVWEDGIEDDGLYIKVSGANVDGEDAEFCERLMRVPAAVFDRIAADVAAWRRQTNAQG